MRAVPFLAAGACLLLASPASAVRPAPALPAVPLGYADVADLALGAPVVATVTVARATALNPADAPGVGAGQVRFYVQAEVTGLLRGADPLPAEVSFLADLPLDARGRPPRIRGARAVVFGERVSGRPGELRLIAPDAQVGWSPALEETVRAVLGEALGSAPPPQVTRVGNAFHVPGSLPGESETQIFLETRDQRPVSLSVLRRPGEAPHWSVALGEMVDEAAGPPAPRTLLWYRLACTLPPQLPGRSVADLGAEDAAAAREDYRVVLAGLGSCGRRRAATAGGAQAGPAAQDEISTPTAAQSE